MGKKEEIRALDTEIKRLKLMIDEGNKLNKSFMGQIAKLNRDMAILAQDKDKMEKDKAREIALLKKKVKKFSEEAKSLVKEKNRLIKERDEQIKSLKAELSQPDFIMESGGGDLKLPNGTVIAGGIRASESIMLGEGCDIQGGLSAGGDVIIGEKSKVHGDVNSNSDVRCSRKCEVDGNIEAKGMVFIGDWSIAQEISSGDKVTVGKNSQTRSIEAGKSISIEDGARIDGNITYRIGVSIGKGVMISGSLRFMSEDGSQPAEGEVIVKEHEAEAAKGERQRKFICPICGSVNKVDSTACATCGEELKEDDKPTTPEAKPAGANDLKFRLPGSK